MAAAPAYKPQKQPRIDTFYVIRKGIPLLAGKSNHPKLSGAPQLLAITFLVGETFALPRDKSEAPPDVSRAITTREMARMMGTSEKHAIVVLNDARSRGILQWYSTAEARKEGLSIAAGKGHAQGKHYRLLVETWSQVKEYEPPKLAVVEDEAGEEQAGEEQAGEEQAGKPLEAFRLGPGSKVKPRPLPEGAKKFAFSGQISGELAIEPVFSFGTVFFKVSETAQQNQRVPKTPLTSRLKVSPDLCGEILLGLKERKLPVSLSEAARYLRDLENCPLEDFWVELDNQRRRKRPAGEVFTTALIPWVVKDALKHWKDAQRAARAIPQPPPARDVSAWDEPTEQERQVRFQLMDLEKQKLAVQKDLRDAGTSTIAREKVMRRLRSIEEKIAALQSGGQS